MKYSPLVALSLAVIAAAHPMTRRAAFTKQNGMDAIALNKKFASLTTSSSCTSGEDACVGSAFAQCVNGKFITTPCGSGEICAALPLVNSPGTSVTCTTPADRDARIAATGAQSGSSSGASSPNGANSAAAAGGKNSVTKSSTAVKATGTKAAAKSAASNSSGSGGNAQTSLTLDPSVIAKGFEQDGQATKEAGQVPSLTSSNNFINFCATTKQPITNGQQVKGGSCNPAPMGSIPSTANMPSSKFKNPKNLDTIPANKNFTITMAIQGMETGNFVNAQQNYFAAPQQLNSKGQIVGHSHVVIEAIDSLTQTTPTDPTKFAFFLGLNAAATNGVLTAVVANGLPAGTYRLASINTAANHQPCLVPIAQHGFLDDAVYFTVTDNGKSAAGAASNSKSAVGGTKSTGTQSTAAKATMTSTAKNTGKRPSV